MDAGKRSGAGAGAYAKDNSVIDQIMLKFRPIAPRPVAGGSSGQSLPLNDVAKKRVKRKYVRVKKKKKEADLTINDDKSWLDLDISEGKEFVVPDLVKKAPNWISFDLSRNNKDDIISSLLAPAPPPSSSPSDLHELDLAASVHRAKVVESWITMETVTGACEDGMRLGYTDEEKWKHLETDSCPGFISSGCDEVQWVNLAFRRMVDANPCVGAPPPEVVVWLRVKVENSAVIEYLPAFSCRVRMVYQLSKKKTQMTVPCDVWKMDFGGFAWRLDVEAALSLGPLN